MARIECHGLRLACWGKRKGILVRGPGAVGIRDHTHCISSMMRFRVAHRDGLPKPAEGAIVSGQGDSGRLLGEGRH